MTVYYLDLENGNNANDGTTFANRKLTIAGFTSAILAPGDTVRIMASTDPVSPGNATWTDNSGTVTWAAAKNAVIDNCDSAWTASANVTVAASGTARKEGTAAALITPATAFTTGKMAYKDTGTLDLSAFQGVSFWCLGGALTAAGALELRLCSDTTGDVTVHTIPFEGMTGSVWAVHTWDNGAALSSSIKSVSLWANSDPGTTAFRLDNLVACTAVGASDHVSHKSIISKMTTGEPEWYPILSIAADSVVIGGPPTVNIGSTSTISPMPYRGTSETVATYVRRGAIIPGVPNEADRTVQDSGTDTDPIVFSGGWNRTDMSTQTGATYICGRGNLTNGIAVSKNWVNFEKIGGILLRNSVVASGGSGDLKIELEDVVGCGFGPYYGSYSDVRSIYLSVKNVFGAISEYMYINSTTPPNGATKHVFKCRRIQGATSTSTTHVALRIAGNWNMFVEKIDNNNCWGAHGEDCTFAEGTLNGTVFANNIGDIIYGAGVADIILNGCTYSTYSISSTNRSGRIRSTRNGGVATAHSLLAEHFSVVSNASVRHTASGVSWQALPTNITECTHRNPAFFSLAKIAVNASALVTVKCWLRRTNTGLTASIRLVPSDIVGTPLTITETQMTAAADTWEEVTLTFTPSAAGVVEIEGCAWGGTTYSAYFDDMTITQA